jgi:hypothetical protein
MGHHEALLGKALESFPHRTPAYTHLLGYIRFDQPFARSKFSVKDSAPHDAHYLITKTLAI